MTDIYNREDEKSQPPSFFPAYASTVRRKEDKRRRSVVKAGRRTGRAED